MDDFVFASQSETQGLLVIAEAMAAGKPVMALDGPAVRKIVSDEETGVLLDGGATSRALASALGSLVDDPGLSGCMAEGARRTAAGNTPPAVGSGACWICMSA
jgi:glycosyltransferase involved in cell wall biosynthesis